MKTLVLALGLLGLTPLANAQIVIQAPALPGVAGQRGDQGDYWRRAREGEREAEWRRRAEYREEAHRKPEWGRAHCVRDWKGREFCRR